MQSFLPWLSFEAIAMDSADAAPLYQQLYQNLRQAILSGDLPGGTRLPSTRIVAAELGISRNTVLNAFDQLIAEGYLEGRVGAGTWVTEALPETFLQTETLVALTNKPSPQPGVTDAVPPKLSQRGALMAGMSITPSPGGEPCVFRPGLPALDAFPRKIWESLFTRRWRSLAVETLSYGGCCINQCWE